LPSKKSSSLFSKMSTVGNNWRKERLDKNGKMYNYIERYNLLRNISSDDLGKIDIKKYYPNLKLEHE